jgi:hypothetical protein
MVEQGWVKVLYGDTCHQFKEKITAYCYGYKSVIVAALVAFYR